MCSVPLSGSHTRPVVGPNQPRWPLRCAVNHTPSGAGATSWMPVGSGVRRGQDCVAAEGAARGPAPAHAMGG